LILENNKIENGILLTLDESEKRQDLQLRLSHLLQCSEEPWSHQKDEIYKHKGSLMLLSLLDHVQAYQNYYCENVVRNGIIVRAQTSFMGTY